MQEHSRVSHPIDMQRLVLEGDGLAFIREGTALLAGLTTRPILGKPWTVDTAFISTTMNIIQKLFPCLCAN